MWSRAELKSGAKEVLRQRYWIPFVVSMIAGFLSGSGSGGPGISFSFTSPFSSIFEDQQQGIPSELLIMMVVVIVVMIFVSILVTALMMFVNNPIDVGKKRFYMENRIKEASLEQLFFAFKNKYLNIVRVMFMRWLFISLWSLLFVIPGIVKTYQYRMVPYILSENPEIGWRRALELSKAMTANEKMKIFVLDLSFIGWSILGLMACCIGLTFLQPYIDATGAELYQVLRDKVLSENLASHDELPGYERPALINVPV